MRKLTFNYEVTLFALLIILLGVSGCEEKRIYSFGEEEVGGKIYIPQANQSGGSNTFYNVPVGKGETTRNVILDTISGNLQVDLGVLRSGSFEGESFTVNLQVDDDLTQEIINSGDLSDAVPIETKDYQLPEKVDVIEREATFELSIDYDKVFNDFGFFGKKVLLSIRLTNPTKYELNEDLSVVTVVIDVDAIRELYYEPKKDFVYKREGKLMLNDREYHGIGIDGSLLNGCNIEGDEAFTEEDIDELFSTLPDDAFVKFNAFASFEERSDYIFQAAERYNIKVMPVLLEGENEGCGPYWVGSSFYREEFKEEGGWLDYVKETVDKYKDLSAIGAWMIVSQPTEWMSAANLEDMSNFYQTVAETIKLIDPDHLVATGSKGEYVVGPSTDGTNYGLMHNSIFIDIGTLWDTDQDRLESWHFPTVVENLQKYSKVLVIDRTRLDGGPSGSGCMFDYNTRVDEFIEKADYYLSRGTSFFFTPRLVKGSTGCGSYFDTEDPLFQTAIDLMKDYFED